MKSFRDGKGTDWTPMFDTPALVEITRTCNVSLQEIISQDVQVYVLFKALWCSCQEAAIKLQMTEQDFFKRITPDKLGEAFEVVKHNAMEAFPKLKMEGKGPFVPSK